MQFNLQLQIKQSSPQIQTLVDGEQLEKANFFN